MELKEFKHTTGDKNLDAAVNALMTSATYGDSQKINLAGKLEKAYLDFKNTLEFRLIGIHEGCKYAYEGLKEGCYDVSTLDKNAVAILAALQKLNQDIQYCLLDYYDQRADVIRHAAVMNQNLAQAIVDYADKRRKDEACAADSDLET